MASWVSSRPNWNRPRRSTHLLLALSFVFALLSSVHAGYFVVNQPSSSSPWVMDSPYPVSWTKGLDDGIESFDVEITRLNQDGLYLVAQNVPATYKKLNVLLQDVPENDDYFLICLNSTSSIIYSVSDRFTVTNSSSSQNPSPDPSAPTVTISGTPNPLKQFAVTLGPSLNGATSLLFGENPRALGFSSVLVLCAVFLGGAMTLA